MHTRVLHIGRKWQRANNHMDCRHCPECGGTVNGQAAQNKHRDWHEQLAEILDTLGQVPDEPEPVPWTAAVGELEADSGA